MSKKLLLADDSITIQKVIQITFAHEDYDLTITDNGDTAFAKAQEVRPDLVIADIYMPGKNGYELTAAIKQDPALQHVPVLLLAGSFEPFDEDKARSCRANAWIEKPFESQTLIDKVSELLESAPAPAAPAPSVEIPAVEPVAEPQAEEPVMAMEDPFGDISFDEEPLTEQPAAAETVAPEAFANDWSDLAQLAEEPVTAEPPAVSEPQVAETPLAGAAAVDEDFSFETAEPEVEEVASFEEEFSFSEDVVEPAPPVTAPVTEPAQQFDDFDFDSFDEVEDVMPLDDEDILGAEDLEPAPPEPTLTPWSRSDVEEEDIFATSDEEELFGELPPLQEEPMAVAEEMIVEEELLDAFDEPTPVAPAPVQPVAVAEEVAPPAPELVAESEPVIVPEPEVAVAVAPQPTAPAALAVVKPEAPVVAEPVDVEQKVAALSEADLEAIVEKVAGRMIEKLADTVLERIAWEVVPDLAENLIREEIRKIKEEAA